MTDPIPDDNVVPLRAVETDHFLVPRNAQQIADMFVRAFYTTDSGLKLLILYRKIYYAYNGSYYAALEDGFIRDRVYNYLADAFTREGKKPPARFKADRGFISTVLECIASVTRVDQTTIFPFWNGSTEPPFPAERTVVFRNGILDMLSGQLIPSTPEHVSLNCLDGDYDPDATWDKWQDIVRGCLLEDAVEAFQEAGGLTITKDMSFEKIFHPHGPTRSGKGLLMTALRQCVGPYNCVSTTIQALSSRFALDGSRNKLMLSVTELRLSKNVDTQSALTKLLGISGRDPMPVEGKNKAEETLELDVRIWIESNEIAGMPDSTGAFAARLIIFRVKERTGEEDKTLKAQVKQNTPAIFNWFRAGYLRLIRRGKFIQPASSLPVLARIRYDGNPLLEFFETQIVHELGAKVLRGSIFDYCERWHAWNRRKYYGPSWVGREAQKHELVVIRIAGQGCGTTKISV